MAVSCVSDPADRQSNLRPTALLAMSSSTAPTGGLQKSIKITLLKLALRSRLPAVGCKLFVERAALSSTELFQLLETSRHFDIDKREIFAIRAANNIVTTFL